LLREGSNKESASEGETISLELGPPAWEGDNLKEVIEPMQLIK